MDIQGCRLCPRHCDVDRRKGERGVCGVSGTGVFLARAALHFYEEPCITGRGGSGAVFFCGCNLHCVYCQNGSISSMKEAKEVPVQRLSRIFLELQDKGAENINLVTPTHYSLQIIEALKEAKALGLTLPVVYNCSGYESVDTLRLLEPWIDIYLTDFKYMDEKLALHFSHAEDYPEKAKAALAEMVRQKPSCVFDGEGRMRSGVIVRHLLLPGHVKNAREVVDHVADHYGEQVYLSVMNQYTPVRSSDRFPELNRRVTKREYERLIGHILERGIENCYIQEGKTAEESFIPAFDFEGVGE